MSHNAVDPEKLFVSTEWLAERLTQPDLRIFDASWHMPNSGRDPRAEFLQGHIPGAVFFDIDAIADHSTDLPHMLPDPLAFAAAMSALGFGSGMRAVVYDSLGLFSAPRLWWTLRAFGCADVAILSGGLPKWIAEGRRLEQRETAGRKRISPRTSTTPSSPMRARSRRRSRASRRRSSTCVRRNASGARSRSREPGVRSGPHSGRPQSSVEQAGRERRAEKAGGAPRRNLPPRATIPQTRKVLATCGSGVTASILALRSPPSATTPRRSMTAPGRNGAPAPICPSFAAIKALCAFPGRLLSRR